MKIERTRAGSLNSGVYGAMVTPKSNECPIWGTIAQVEGAGDGVNVHSMRAGGFYRITGSALTMLDQLSPGAKAKVTTWIVDQNRAGNTRPVVTGDVIESVGELRPMKMSQRRERFWLALSQLAPGPTYELKLWGQLTDETKLNVAHFSAWTEALGESEANALARMLLEEGYFQEAGMGTLRLTGKGFEELERHEAGGASTRQAFVAMWLDESMKEAWEVGIVPAVRAAGYEPFRVDQKEHANKIDDEIIAEIRRSRFVIADFTCNIFEVGGSTYANARGGVYYEAGFAQGLGTPVIWMTREDTINHVHFDTRQFAHITWTSGEDLRTKLFNRIAAVIGLAPGAPGLENPAQ